MLLFSCNFISLFDYVWFFILFYDFFHFKKSYLKKKKGFYNEGVHIIIIIIIIITVCVITLQIKMCILCAVQWLWPHILQLYIRPHQHRRR